MTAQQGQSSTDAPSSAMTTTVAAGLQSDDGTATPPVDAQLAAYSAYSGATSQVAPTSYVPAASNTTSYANQPGATTAAAGAAQYSYAYGQGYGNYAAYAAAGAYAAYGSYPGQYYQGELWFD